MQCQEQGCSKRGSECQATQGQAPDVLCWQHALLAGYCHRCRQRLRRRTWHRWALGLVVQCDHCKRRLPAVSGERVVLNA